MTLWFGDPWPTAELRAPVCENDADRVPTPVGRACLQCDRPVADGDRGVLIPHVFAKGPDGWEMRPQHLDCLLRAILPGYDGRYGTTAPPPQ